MIKFVPVAIMNSIIVLGRYYYLEGREVVFIVTA